jgi:hypothetical protein
VEIGAVDRESCRGTRTRACADLIRELAAVTGPLRSTELIYCWDPDGPTDPRGFARADHCDHIHWGTGATVRRVAAGPGVGREGARWHEQHCR